MEKFQIRYFRGDVLESVETLEAPDLLEVIDRASPPEREVTAEIWSRIGNVGMIGPMAEPSVEERSPPEKECQAAELMKRRLRLVRS